MAKLIKKIMCSRVLKRLAQKEHMPILSLLLFCLFLIPRTTYASNPSSCYYAETENYCPTYNECRDYIGPLPNWCVSAVTVYSDGSGGRIDAACWGDNLEGCPCCAAGTQNSQGQCLYWLTTCAFGASHDLCRNNPQGTYRKDGILYCCPGTINPCCNKKVDDPCCKKPDDPSCTCPIKTGSGSAGTTAAAGDNTSTQASPGAGTQQNQGAQ
jgi:hypothetical protein